jgi:hypothetical protein
MFIISYFNKQDDYGISLFFAKAFMSERIFRNISVLPIFSADKMSLYLLTDKQNRKVITIFEKIKAEDGSGYIYSQYLQRLYLIELIHFIMKMYQENPGGGQPSAN